MTTLPLVLVKTQQEYNDQNIILEKRLGQGAFGLTFLISRGKEKRVVKFLTSDENGEEVLKEAIIGFELKKRLPDHITPYFTGVFRLIVCKDISMPKEVIEAIQNDPSLTDKFQKATEFYIIEQEFISNATTGMDWLASQENSVSEDIIRSVMFQLVISLCYAQNVLGFQHNDLKLENLMFVPNNTSLPIYIPYQFPDGDIFELVIPVGGVQVRIIDLGASSLFGRDINKQPSYINAKTAHTPGCVPFEYNLYPDYNLEGILLEQRMNDADIPGLFKIMLNLTSHNKNGWKYVVGDDGTGADYSEITVSSNIIKELKKLFSKTLFTPKPEETSQQAYEQDKQLRVVAVLAETSILINLGIPLKLYNDIKYFSLSSLDDVVKKQILTNYEILLSGEFNQIAETVKKFDTIISALDSELGLHFIRALARPFSYNRQSFGLPKPFDTYSLANALYHPFFAYYYWKTNTSHTLHQIRVTIDAPLIFLGDTATEAKLAPSKFAKAYLKSFNNLKKASVVTKKTDSSDSESTVVTKTTTTTTYKEWTQEDFNTLGEKDGVPVTDYSLEDYLGMTDKQIDNLDEVKVLRDIVDYLKAPSIKKTSKKTIIEGLKTFFAQERAKRVASAPETKKKAKATRKAKSPIFEQLESIEHCPDFLIEDKFDTESISEELYIPLREAVAQHPELSKAAEHLGIEKPLFEHLTVDMTKRSNQIRYLHTLSVLAEMVESRNITQDKIERCFVEWPPTPQYRIGEINEI